MKTFYFNTGVKFATLYGKQIISSNGVILIPFKVNENVPDNAELMFICDNPELPESKCKNVIVEPIFNTDIVSKYAYFKIKGE